jgi:ABC-type polysaccharide/polyol phosphate transport system ATPase subunit
MLQASSFTGRTCPDHDNSIDPDNNTEIMAKIRYMPTSDADTLVRVEGVSKKFCLSLKKSLWYGLKDMGNELVGRRHGGHGGLRPKEFWALKDINFELCRGESLGLIGHNGAGKTTLLKMLNGLIKLDAGRIEMRGRVGALISLGAGFNPILTGRENIYVNASVLGLSRRETDAKLDEIIDFAEIGDFIDTPVQNYSSGMGVRLGFAIASTLNPDVLLLDEVLAVGDMNFQSKCLNRLGSIRKSGTSFILVSHNMVNIRRHCSQVVYLKHGQVQYNGGTDEGVAQYEKDMQAAQPPCVNQLDMDKATAAGTGRILIQAVKFLGPDGNLQNAFHTGKPMTIKLEYLKQCDEDIDVMLELKVIDGVGILHQYRKDEVHGISGPMGMRGSVTLHFDSMPFNIPRVWVSLVLWGREYLEQYDWKKAIPLDIITWPHSSGRIHCHIGLSWS